MKRGLSGYIPVRNGNRLDYCWREAARSLLPVVDELILCDSDSDDGTREDMVRWAGVDPKIRVINWPWPNPVGQGRMLIGWLNFARQHCEYDMQITTDADEVLCEKAYPAVREAVAKGGCRWFFRLHFWRDLKHLAPLGKVAGEYVARLGPTKLEMVSDEPRPEGEAEIRLRAQMDERLRFFHYGFVRPAPAFFAKSKVMQMALCNDYDKRLQTAEETGQNWFDLTDVGGPLVPYPEDDHPAVARGWLTERGLL
jgi:glycosyltransferase involved in cell wall biosynthesis